MMTPAQTEISVGFIVCKIRNLGGRMIAACLTALIAAVLIFAAPEVGILGAAGAIVFGSVSAVLLHPHVRG